MDAVDPVRVDGRITQIVGSYNGLMHSRYGVAPVSPALGGMLGAAEVQVGGARSRIDLTRDVQIGADQRLNRL